MTNYMFALALLAGIAVFGTCAWAASDPPPPESALKEPVVSHAAATEHKHTNELIHETSPYLLQHAHNPVNWYPWGAKAFDKARAEGKPIFLSVGYSSCH